jgi:hypothetical protein
MKKNRFLVLGMLALALNVYAADSDYTVDANGVITKYSGFDTEVVIPATIGGKKITAIGREAFKKAELTSVTLPEGVITIGEGAFYENKLTSITIPGSVKTIGNSAFWYNDIAAIVIPEGVEEVNGAFDGKDGLTITIPSTIRVFRDVLGDKVTVTLPDKLNVNFNGCFGGSGSDGDAIFYQYIANDRKAGTYTPIRNRYSDRKWAAPFRYIETPYGAVLIEYKGESTRVRIPAEIGGIPVKALSETFDKNTSGIGQIDAVQIPESVTYIGPRTFAGQPLASITIPESVTYIGANAFAGNKLTSVTIPAGVTYIGNWAFRENALASVTIPDKVTYIGDEAFSGNKLTAVTIPAGVTYVGSFAFRGMRIKTITLPPSVKILGGNPLFGGYADYTDNTVHGTSIVIGANVAVEHEGTFKRDYDKNGRKAGRYTVAVNRGAGSENWAYSAK